MKATKSPNGKIGIGITEHNRYHIFKKSYVEIKRYLPPNAVLVVIDDASNIPVPEADFRFEKNVGIAASKNKCFELLYKNGYEHIFLFDSDTYPLKPGWWKPYVESKELHLNYIFEHFATGRSLGDTKKVYQDNEIVAYSHPRGCMMYYHRYILEKVGGMNPIFGKWGYEHPNLSDRIYMAGLTSFRYMDVVNSKGLFYSDDEQNNNKNTTVGGLERFKLIERNKRIYENKRYFYEYVPFFEKENILLTCYFTGVKDTQIDEYRNTNLSDLDPLIASLRGQKLVVLHDCFGDENIKNVEFIRVPTSINPYFQRWISYREYLMKNRAFIDNVFCIDGTDVEVINPINWSVINDRLITGDENEKIDNVWLKRHHIHNVLSRFYKDYSYKQLLNAGILGGNVDTIIEFVRQVLDCYVNMLDGKNNTDMAIFNYIAYTNWENRLWHGEQINTEFKKFETNNYSWFKHK